MYSNKTTLNSLEKKPKGSKPLLLDILKRGFIKSRVHSSNKCDVSSMFWPSAVRRVIWLDCQEFVTSMYLSLIQLAMTYRQAHGRAAL